ncbi:MAG: hypothetical protein ABJC04_03005 [Verrucomicrobiota bacterium]
MKTLLELSSEQLRKAAHLKEQITSLEKQLQAIFGQTAKVISPAKNRGGMSPAARARIATAMKARWAKIKAVKNGQRTLKGSSAAQVKTRKPMSAARKAQISATQKARWAKIKGASNAK